MDKKRLYESIMNNINKNLGSILNEEVDPAEAKATIEKMNKLSLELKDFASEKMKDAGVTAYQFEKYKEASMKFARKEMSEEEYKKAIDDVIANKFPSTPTSNAAVKNNFPAYKPKNKEELVKIIQKFWKEKNYDAIANKIDTSLITDMSNLFKTVFDSGDSADPVTDDCKNFNINLSKWNVSNVTNMAGMFSYCPAFNLPLNNWNVSNVTNMAGMFRYCKNFNQPLDAWNVSNVKSLYCTFLGCENFNLSLDKWNVSNVTNMTGTFSVCKLFNLPLNNWDVSNVTEMRSMFANCYKFDLPLDKWNVSKVTNMDNMFSHTNFSLDISNWDVRNVKYDSKSNAFIGSPIIKEDRPKFNSNESLSIRNNKQLYESIMKRVNKSLGNILK